MSKAGTKSGLMHCKHFTISQRLFCPFCQKQITIRRANLTREKVRVVFNLRRCYSSVFVNTAGDSLQQLKTKIPNLNWISTHLWSWTTIHISERSYPMVEKAAARFLLKKKKNLTSFCSLAPHRCQNRLYGASDDFRSREWAHTFTPVWSPQTL